MLSLSHEGWLEITAMVWYSVRSLGSINEQNTISMNLTDPTPVTLKKITKPETHKTWVTLKASILTGHVCIRFSCVESFQNDQRFNLSCRMKPHLQQMVGVLSWVCRSDFWREKHAVSEVHHWCSFSSTLEIKSRAPIARGPLQRCSCKWIPKLFPGLPFKK